MNKRSQAGFAMVEVVVLVVLLAGIGTAGYYVWHNSHKGSQATTSGPSGVITSNYQSPPVTTPAAPQITSASDLNTAMQTLNQTSISSNNTDSSQLTTYTASF